MARYASSRSFDSSSGRDAPSESLRMTAIERFVIEETAQGADTCLAQGYFLTRIQAGIETDKTFILRMCRTYGALFLFDPFPALAPSARQARLGPCWATSFRAYGAWIGRPRFCRRSGFGRDDR